MYTVLYWKNGLGELVKGISKDDISSKSFSLRALRRKSGPVLTYITIDKIQAKDIILKTKLNVKSDEDAIDFLHTENWGGLE